MLATLCGVMFCSVGILAADFPRDFVPFRPPSPTPTTHSHARSHVRACGLVRHSFGRLGGVLVICKGVVLSGAMPPMRVIYVCFPS